jgi:uncharacterized protein YjbJ (UPF0337 family)
MSNTYSGSTDQTAAGFASQAKGVARDLKAKAGDVTDSVTRAAKDQASQLGSAARDMASSAKDKVETAVSQQVTQQKSVGADYIGSIAQAASRAAGEFDQDLPQAAHYIRQASEQIQGVADTVRERDVRELVGEVQDFARRQPTLFFGGAVVLGFAALRFLKSSAPDSSAQSRSNGFEQRREG